MENKQEEFKKESSSIKGNLGANPEFKELEGKKVASFSVATHDEKNVTKWQKVHVYGEYIEKAQVNQLAKGDFVEIKGFYGREYKNSIGEPKKDFIGGETKILKKAEVKEALV